MTETERLVILIDAAIHLSYPRDEVVRGLVAGLLETLGPEQSFSLVAFHDEIEGYRMGNFCPRDEAQLALVWLDNLARRRGGSDLRTLMQRLSYMPGAVRVVLLSCGQPEYQKELIDMGRNWPSAVSLWALAIDQDPQPYQELCSTLRGKAWAVDSQEYQRGLETLLGAWGLTSRRLPATPESAISEFQSMLGFERGCPEAEDLFGDFESSPAKQCLMLIEHQEFWRVELHSGLRSLSEQLTLVATLPPGPLEPWRGPLHFASLTSSLPNLSKAWTGGGNFTLKTWEFTAELHSDATASGYFRFEIDYYEMLIRAVYQSFPVTIQRRGEATGVPFVGPPRSKESGYPPTIRLFPGD